MKPKSRRPKSKPKPKPPSEFTEFVAAFTLAYEAARGVKPEWGEKQGAQVKRLLKKPGGAGDALARTRRMFEMAGEGWPETPDLGTLVSCWDKFAPPVAKTEAKQDVTRGRVEPMAFDDYPEAGSEAKDW